MNGLPNELVHDIVENLNVEDLQSVRLVDRTYGPYVTSMIFRAREDAGQHDMELLENMALVARYATPISFKVLRSMVFSTHDYGYRDERMYSLVKSGIIDDNFVYNMSRISDILRDRFRYFSRVEVHLRVMTTYRNAHSVPVRHEVDDRRLVFEDHPSIQEILDGIGYRILEQYGMRVEPMFRGTSLFLSIEYNTDRRV